MILNHNQLTDLELENALKHCSLEEKLFSHEAHVRLAFIHIKNYGVQKACANLSQQIKQYALFLKLTDVYHETLTIFSVKIIGQYMNEFRTSSFDTFINKYPQLTSDFKSMVKVYYSEKLINSHQAKIKWVEPDLIKLN